ncbi:MAG: TIGR03016 family PEP-CTERM system-associated outer membrane protein [Gammaproteobacteria bacterium]|nr:TIGR03016 family PEP-CTERM system-associated outer membrane protein [Gammaproteobacteria bacterium]
MSLDRMAIADVPLRHGSPRKKTLTLLACFLFAAYSSGVCADDWQFHPSLRASETYSNNIRLDRFNPQHDWVSELAAGFSVNRTVDYSSTIFGYQLQGLHFVRTPGMDEVFQQLHGVTHLQGSETGPYLDGLASLSQQTIDANLPSVSDNVFATGNRTDQTDLSLGPGLRSKLGSTALSDLKFSHSQTEYAKGRIDSFNDAINLQLSDLHPKRLDWQLSARRERVRYSNDAATEFRNTLLNVQISATKRVRVVLTGGYDDSRSESPGLLSRDGSRWSAGLEWSPSHRSRLLLTTGERYFGTTYQMELSHTYHQDRWAMSYAEDVVTTANDAALLDQVSAGVNGVATYTTDIYLSKLFTGSYFHKGPRGNVNVQVYQDRREFGGAKGVEELRSAFVQGFISVRPRTSLHASASLLDRNPANSTGSDKTRDLSIWVAHELEKGGSVSLRFRNLHRADSAIVNGYEASSLSIAYERQFGPTSLAEKGSEDTVQ